MRHFPSSNPPNMSIGDYNNIISYYRFSPREPDVIARIIEEARTAHRI